MRSIKKSVPHLYHLNQAHQNPPTTPSEATSRWSSYGYKADTLASLLREQFQVCCYSEIPMLEEGIGFHVEHVENKSQNPSRTFDYGNLAASAFSSEDLEGRKILNSDIFGGHASGKNGSYGPIDMLKFISPHDPNCSSHFTYLSDGRVVPSRKLEKEDQEKSRYTIDILNLNCNFLVNRRKKWWKELQDLFEEHQKKNWSLNDLVAVDLLSSTGLLRRFFSVTRQFYGPLAEKILTEEEPDLL